MEVMPERRVRQLIKLRLVASWACFGMQVYNTQGPYFFTTKQYMKRLLKGYQALKESNKSDEAMVDDEALKSVRL